MLTSLVKKRLDIPNEDAWLEIRMLSGKCLDEARAAKLNTILATAKAMGKELSEQIQQARGDAPETPDDPLAAVDVDVVLNGGIVSWSYIARKTPENVADLDEETRNWAAKSILEFTTQTEEARRKV